MRPSDDYPYSPRTEGAYHFNAYSRSRTPEGRMLSNFHVGAFRFHGIEFPSVEHVYQGHFAPDPETRRALFELSPRELKRRAKAWKPGKGAPVETWDGRRIGFRSPEWVAEIKRAVTEKVRQRADVRAALRATGSLPIVHYYFCYGRVLPRPGYLETHLMDLRSQVR